MDPMSPKQEWGAFSVIFVLADLVIAAGLIEYGFETLPVVIFATIALVIFGYVVYKRYHVEVVPESDIALFEDPDDLRILSEIYGLDASGDEDALRARLTRFARENKDRAFVWIAPRMVSTVASTFGMAESETTARKKTTSKELVQRVVSEPRPGSYEPQRLVWGTQRTEERRSHISECPVCDSPAPEKGMVCTECGADLEFYIVLSESKVGRMIISEKAETGRRKD